jgi:hypothetical protein
MPGKAAHEKKKRLSKGRAIRHVRASALRALRQGELSIMDVLSDPQDLSGSTVYTVLTNTPKLGEKGAQKVLEHLEIWPMKKLGLISPERRAELYGALPERVKNFRS